MEATPFLQSEHPFTSDAVMDLQMLAGLAEDDAKAKQAIDDLCDAIAAELSAARERRQQETA